MLYPEIESQDDDDSIYTFNCWRHDVNLVNLCSDKRQLQRLDISYLSMQMFISYLFLLVHVYSQPIAELCTVCMCNNMT